MTKTLHGEALASLAPNNPKQIDTSHLGMAEEFARRYGHRLRYLADRRRWMVLDESGRWVADASLEHMRAAKELACEVARITGRRGVLSASHVNGVIRMAKSEPGILALAEDLDRGVA